MSMEETFQKCFSDMEDKLLEALIPVQKAIAETFKRLNKIAIKIKRFQKYRRMMENISPKKRDRRTR